MGDNEKALLQRRIKNQRRELKRLNKTIIELNLRMSAYRHTQAQTRSFAYKQAADMADRYFGGRRIADRIRRWI